MDFNKCNACGICCNVCPAKALEICGKKMSYNEILDEVLKDKSFYDP
ncbi:MAG TPA: hypothetical protein VIK72_10455 [Clostridiaceae bacterium]